MKQNNRDNTVATILVVSIIFIVLPFITIIIIIMFSSLFIFAPKFTDRYAESQLSDQQLMQQEWLCNTSYANIKLCFTDKKTVLMNIESLESHKNDITYKDIYCIADEIIYSENKIVNDNTDELLSSEISFMLNSYICNRNTVELIGNYRIITNDDRCRKIIIRWHSIDNKESALDNLYLYSSLIPFYDKTVKSDTIIIFNCMDFDGYYYNFYDGKLSYE